MSNKLPAADTFIKAAAELSGRDPGELDEREAIYILQVYGIEMQGDLYRQLTDDAAEEFFSDPQNAADWADAAKEWDGETPDLLAFALQRDLSPIIRERARKLYDDLPQDDPQREELKQILVIPLLSPEMREALNKTINGVRDVVAETIHPIFKDIQAVQEAIAPGLHAMQEAAQTAIAAQEAIRAAMEPATRVASELFKQFGQTQEAISELFTNNPAFVLFDEINGDLLPYITEELKKPQYNGKDIAALWEEAEESEGGLFSENTLLMQAVNAARAAAGEPAVKEEAAAVTVQPQKAPEHLAITEMNFTTDRLPYIFFGGSLPAPAREEVPGQLRFDTIKEKYSDGNHAESFIYWHYFIDEATFEKLGLSKVYDYEDYFILCVLFTERILGNAAVSPTALYRDVYGKDPGDDDLETFKKRLQKLDATRVYINNHDLMETWKGTDPDATYIEGLFHLVNIEFVQERYLFNGKVAREVIRIGEVPALLQIGADLNRMTKIPKSAFYVVDHKTGRRVRGTPRYWHALIYLTRRVAQMKNGSGETKILYDTLYKELHATRARERQLTRDVVYKILEHWRRIGWIKAYKEETTRTTGKVGIKIILPGSAITEKKRRQITKKTEKKQ